METNRGLFSKNIDNVNIDRSAPKIVVMAVLGVAFSFGFSYFIDSFITNQNLQTLAISLGSLSGFLIIFLFQSLFIKSIWHTNLIIFLESAGVLAGFYQRISSPLVGSVAGLLFLILIWANYNGWRELQNMMKVKFWRISKVVLPKAIGGIALFSSIILVFPSVISNPIEGNYQLPFSKSLIEKIIVPASDIVKNFIPGFDLSLPLQELAVNVAAQQVKDAPEAQILPKAAQQQLINKTAQDFETKIAELIGGQIKPNSKITDIVYESLSNRFSQMPESAKNLVLAGVVFLIFLTIEGFAIPLRWLVSVLAFVIYEILLMSGFATVMLEGKSKEIIILK